MARCLSQSHSGLLLLQGHLCWDTLYSLHRLHLFIFFVDGMALKFDAGCRPRVKVAMKRSLWPQPKNSVFLRLFHSVSPCILHLCFTLSANATKAYQLPRKIHIYFSDTGGGHRASALALEAWKSDMSDMI